MTPSKSQIIYLVELNAAVHAANTSALLTFTNLIDPVTELRVSKTVAFSTGAATMAAAAMADLWVNVLSNAGYGIMAVRGSPNSALMILVVPYCAEAPFTGLTLVNPNGMVSALNSTFYLNPHVDKFLTELASKEAARVIAAEPPRPDSSSMILSALGGLTAGIVLGKQSSPIIQQTRSKTK